MNGKDLVTAAVLAALVLVVGAYFVVASAQARSPVQQCFDAQVFVAEQDPRFPDTAVEIKALELRYWTNCIHGGR